MQTTKLISLVVLLALSGCAAPLVLTGIGVASVATNETTGKSITDNTVSAINGKDCRVSRAFTDQTVCQNETLVKLKITTTGVTPSTVAEIESKYR